MNYQDDYGNEAWIKRVEELSGYTAENTGGNVWCFIFEVGDKTLYFGYNDKVFSVGDEEGSFYESLNIEDESPENEAKFIDSILEKYRDDFATDNQRSFGNGGEK